MNWTYSIQQKTTAAILLTVVVAVVFVINRLESNKINELGTSMNSVYEDRLLVENYIFRLSGLLYEKKILLDQCTSAKPTAELTRILSNQNTDIEELVDHYSLTYLTKQEAMLFNMFKKEIAKIEREECQFLKSTAEGHNGNQVALTNNFYSATSLLRELSNLQVNVGRSANERSKQLVAGTNLLTHFELAMLVVIGLLVQALLFSSKSASRQAGSNPMLN